MADIRFGPIVVPVDGAWQGDNAIINRTQSESLARRLFPDPQASQNGLVKFDQCGEIPLSRLIVSLRQDAAARALVQGIIVNNLNPLSGPVEIVPNFPIYVSKRRGIELRTLDGFKEGIEAVKALRPDWTPGAHYASSIPVIFGDFGRVRGMTSPGWPLFLNLELWNEGSTAFRTGLVAHELFHQLQYSYGFRARHPGWRYAWFSEGTATWMEQASDGALTSPPKLYATASHPEIGLLNSSYYAFPFWMEYLSDDTMAGLWERYKNGLDPEQATAQMDRASEWLRKRRLSGPARSVRVEAAPGVANQEAVPNFRAKQIYLDGGGVATMGCLPRFGVAVYDVDGTRGSRWSAGVNLPLQVTAYRKWGPIFRTVERPENLKVPFRVVVHAPGESAVREVLPFRLELAPGRLVPPEVSAPRRLSRPTTALPLPPRVRNVDLAVDGLGNVFVTYPLAGTRMVIGYQVDGHSSIAEDDLRRPAGWVGWLRAGVPSDGTVFVTPSANFSTGFESILRRVKVTAALELEITTEVTGEMTDYESIVLTGTPLTSANRNLDHDGSESPACERRNSDDCDGDTRPNWFLGFGGQPAVNPIVPYSGKAYLPAPLPAVSAAGTRTIVEKHRLLLPT